MNEYATALSEWLQSTPWDYFITVTTRKQRTDSIALIRDIKEEIQKDNQTCKMFLACEPHRLNRNLHAHGLVLTGNRRNKDGSIFGLDPSYALWNDLFHRFGRSRVELVRSKADVAAYCTKYVTKLTDGDNWDYYDLTT